MLLKIKRVLNKEQLIAVQQLLGQGQYLDGKLSAGREARGVKHNQELEKNSPLHQKLNQIVMMSLLHNNQFQTAALPVKVATPYYVRYNKGMTYGAHVDDPVMGPLGQQYRSDVSTTVFLNNPDEYEGGELVIQTTYGEQVIKLDAGDAIVYPSGSLHSVSEVTHGQRLAAVVWSQSMIADPAKREMLYELADTRDQLQQLAQQSQKDKNGTSLDNEIKRISHVYANLTRMWAQI